MPLERFVTRSRQMLGTLFACGVAAAPSPSADDWRALAGEAERFGLSELGRRMRVLAAALDVAPSAREVGGGVVDGVIGLSDRLAALGEIAGG